MVLVGIFLTLLTMSPSIPSQKPPPPFQTSSSNILNSNPKFTTSHHITMLLSFNLRFILFLTLVLTLASVSSDAARVPRAYWEQMLPKKLPSPSSAPSKGTNSITPSSSKAMEVSRNLPTKDGNV
ncbi:unnamed protein product [Citrullus colocynthis]|uniref:Uncharacterized protein n=1 Tax=Citrullus colocynthis TaxID=252529 RepID=A0ABP0Z1P6_9ROSI